MFKFLKKLGNKHEKPEKNPVAPAHPVLRRNPKTERLDSRLSALEVELEQVNEALDRGDVGIEDLDWEADLETPASKRSR